MSTAISKIVNVTISTQPAFPTRQGFGLLNIIGTSARLPSSQRMRVYSTMDEVAVDFFSTDEEYKAASVFFSQSPRASQLAISRRYDVAIAGSLLGSSTTVEKDILDWQLVTKGGFDVNINGTVYKVPGLNFSTDLTLTAVALRIQTALQVLLPATTFRWNGSSFVLGSPTTGVASAVGYLVPPTAVGSPTDIGSLLAMRADDYPSKIAGAAAEASLADTLTALESQNRAWYGFMLAMASPTDTQLMECAQWAQPRTKVFGFTTSAANVLDPAVTTDIASVMKANLYDRSFCTWDPNDTYQIASVFAKAFSVNFAKQNSTLTLKFKQLPGTTPIEINETQRRTLVEKNVNYYTTFGETAMLAEGVMLSGTWFDERHGLDWLQNAVENNVFGYLVARTTKVPQTDKGVAALVQQVELALQEGVNNGLLAPGKWLGDDLGELATGDFLPKGYYVYGQPIADQPQADYALRKSPPISAALKGAGAIHFADIHLNFQR